MHAQHEPSTAAILQAADWEAKLAAAHVESVGVARQELPCVFPTKLLRNAAWDRFLESLVLILRLL